MEKKQNFRNKYITLSIVAVVLVVALVIGLVLVLLPKSDSKEPGGTAESLMQTATYKETLDDVSKDINLELKSDESITSLNGNVSVANQNGVLAACTLKNKGDGEYLLEAPNGGYNDGDTYKVKLLNDEISFKDETYKSRRDITLSVFKEDISKAEYKQDVIAASADTTYKLINEGTQVIVSAEFLASENVYIGSIVVLPVYDDNGFSVQRAYKVTTIENDGNEVLLTVAEPDISEVYEELEIKGNYEAVYSSKYIKASTEENIEKQMSASPSVMALSTMSTSNSNKPKVEVELKIAADAVTLEYKITIPKIFEQVDFTVDGEIEVKLGTKASVSLINGTFDFGAYVSYKNNYKFGLSFEKDLVGGDDGVEICKKAMEKLTNVLNKKAGNKQISIKAFSMFLPSPVPALGFSFDVNIQFKLELKVQLEVTFVDEFSVEVGVKRDSDGLSSYYNKQTKTDAIGIEFSGSIKAKLGLEVKFSGSLAGVLKAGVSFELGVYGKFAGVAKAEQISELTSGDIDVNEDRYCYALYFEAGFYTSLSLFAEVDLKVWSGEAKFTIFETEVPIFGIGYTQQYEIAVDQDSVVLNEGGKTPMPQVTVKIKDMFTGEKTEQNISASDMRHVFDISTENNYCRVDASNNIINMSGGEEFADTITLDLKEWQSFFDIFYAETNGIPTISIEMKKRAIVHYELGALFTHSSKITVTKQPIAIQNVSLSYERITNDSQYADLNSDLSATELTYNYRGDINEIKDFQIGRIVEVIPTITPLNASYKTLTYAITKGAEYIVGGENGITTYRKNGMTYARFRIINDTVAIGNVNGEIDISKEICIEAHTNGYTGNYENWNISSTSKEKIFASGIPVIDYNLTTIVEDNNLEQTAVCAGAEIMFGINSATIFPRNASRGVFGQEELTIYSGLATMIGESTIKINENAEVGSQIVVLSSLSGVERKYYLNIVKSAVETISIGSTKSTLQPGQSTKITANILGNNGSTPTLNEAFFILTSGKEFATIIPDAQVKNEAVIKFGENAPIGAVAKVISIIDGKRSNELEFAVTKIPVTSVTLSSCGELIVERGEVVNLNTQIMPLNASFQTPHFILTEGEQHASLDSRSGRIVFSNSCVGGERVKVKCIVDGKESNIVAFTVALRDVNHIQFPIEYTTVRDGQTIKLDAFVNPEVTNQAINYTVINGKDFATVNGNQLIIKSGLSTGTEIIVRAVSVTNPEVFAEKLFVIYAELTGLSINGQYSSATILQTQTAKALVTDSMGVVIDNNKVDFSITDSFGNPTSLATVSDDGTVSCAQFISENEKDLTVILIARFGGEELQVIIDIVIPPLYISIVTENETGLDYAVLKPNEQITLTVISSKQSNAVDFDNIEIVADDRVSVDIKAEDADHGLKIFKVTAQVTGDAKTGETLTVRARCYILGVPVLSRPFTITVGRTTQSVELFNVPKSMNINERHVINGVGFPENLNYKPVYEFADYISTNYATIDQDTGEIYIKNNAALVGRTITVMATIDGVCSQSYSISIVNKVLSIEISCKAENEGVQYIREYDFYTLYPSGRFIISSKINGDESNDEVYYELDKIGRQYLNIEGNIITVKDTKINSGINATVIAYSANGVVSNTLSIYIPSVIKTVEDWYAIQDNISGYYVLGSDLNFYDVDYQPIAMFGGIIDGAGYSIKNLSVSNLSANNCYGLIEQNYGMIVNLNVRHLSMKISDSNKTAYIGGIVAKNYGYIINCSVQADNGDLLSIQPWDSIAGGIAGMNAGKISGCYNQAYIDAHGFAGGIVGINETSGTVENCLNLEKLVIADFDEEYAVKGIIGTNKGTATDNKNYGTVFDRKTWSYIED